MKYIMTTWAQASSHNLDRFLDIIIECCDGYTDTERELLLPQLAQNHDGANVLYCSLKVGEDFAEKVRHVKAPDDCGCDLTPIEGEESESAVKARRLSEMGLSCCGRRPCLEDCKRLS